MVDAPNIRAAAGRLAPYVMRTPLKSADSLSAQVGCSVYLKMEQLQPTGSFKIRGATNKMLTLERPALDKGVVAASTGNHGMAVARAARILGGRSVIFVPDGAAPSKIEAIERQGAQVRRVAGDPVNSERAARDHATEHGLAYCSPYNDPEVVAGQGTVGLELAEQLPQLDTVYVAVGGGGLAGGIATYLKSEMPAVRIVGCSPENSAVMHHSVRAGRVVDLESSDTLSDGTAGGVERDAITFEICSRLIDDWVLVSENEIRSALAKLVRAERIKAEGSAAVAVAALFGERRRVEGRNVAAIICGGNISESVLRRVISATG